MKCAFVLASVVAAAPQLRLNAEHNTVKFGSKTSARAAFHKLEGKLEKANPLFSKETCTSMFATKLKLGGSVPPNDFVVGCTEVCDSVKAMKEYWSAGANAEYACGKGHEFGCAYDGVPPVSIKEICP